MCTEAEGKELSRTFSKYYKEREVQAEDEKYLDKLIRAAYIECVYKDGKVYARASKIGRGLVYNPEPYIP